MSTFTPMFEYNNGSAIFQPGVMRSNYAEDWVTDKVEHQAKNTHYYTRHEDRQEIEVTFMYQEDATSYNGPPAAWLTFRDAVKNGQVFWYHDDDSYYFADDSTGPLANDSTGPLADELQSGATGRIIKVTLVGDIRFTPGEVWKEWDCTIRMRRVES
jgi:hypothetical protein